MSHCRRKEDAKRRLHPVMDEEKRISGQQDNHASSTTVAQRRKSWLNVKMICWSTFIFLTLDGQRLFWITSQADGIANTVNVCYWHNWITRTSENVTSNNAKIFEVELSKLNKRLRTTFYLHIQSYSEKWCLAFHVLKNLEVVGN